MDWLERGVSGGFIVFDLERFTRQPKDGEWMIGPIVPETDFDRATAIYAASREDAGVHRTTSARPSPSAGNPAAATSSTAGPATTSSPTRMDR
jgi:hypothetical protein